MTDDGPDRAYGDLLRRARSLESTELGVWSSQPAPRRSYPTQGNDLCFAIEDGSFWFRHRNRCLAAVLSHHPPPGVVLDVGGGNGFVTRGLREAGHPAILLEPGRSGIENALRRGLEPVVWSTLETADFPPRSIPAIGLFDVLEHIEDDEGILQRIAKALVPGGLLYVTVPWGRCLWSAHDRAAGHFRRYTKPGLSRRIADAGLESRFVSHVFAALVPVVLLMRGLPYRIGLERSVSVSRSIRDQTRTPTKAILERLVSREVARLARGRPVPLGSSLLLVAEKPAAKGVRHAPVASDRAGKTAR